MGLQESIEALHDKAALIFRDEIDDEWEQPTDGTITDDHPTIALIYSIDCRTWQAAIVYDGGMGSIPLLAGNAHKTPEEAVASLAEEIDADLASMGEDEPDDDDDAQDDLPGVD